MPLIAERKEGKEFEIPKEGTVQAVIAEVEDLGMVEQTYNNETKKVHKLRLRYQLAELDSEGQPKRIYERFTVSMHPKAGLFKRVKGLFGKEPPATFDCELLVGAQANLVLVHNEGKDKQGQPKTFANIAATLKLQPNQKKLEIVAIPKKNEVKQAVAATTNAITPENPISDLDIPF